MKAELRTAILEDLRARHGGSPRLIAEGSDGTLGMTERITVGQYPGPGEVFLKFAGRGGSGMLESEYEGLEALAASETVRVPQALGLGVLGETSWLATEYLELVPASAESDARLGAQLAALHGHTADAHGWDRDNWIGNNPQPNGREGDWTRFFAERRLGYQLRLAAERGHDGPLQEEGQKLLERIPQLLAGHRPEASLLHGDLWSGNRAALADSTPVIYDPAVHYGDGECDLAMSELFGPFATGFYREYQARRPLPPGAGTRRDLYQLYHVLNHLNLFGGGWQNQARNLIRRLLAEAG